MLTGKEFAKQFSEVNVQQKEFASVRLAKKVVAESIKKEAKTGKDFLKEIKSRGGKMAKVANKTALPSEEIAEKIANAAVKAGAKATGKKLNKESMKAATKRIIDAAIK